MMYLDKITIPKILIQILFIWSISCSYASNSHAQNWHEVVKSLASDKQADDEFGYSVSISGDYAIVGARGEDTGGRRAGAAYIFHKDQGGSDNWQQVQKIQARDKAVEDFFGNSVSISGDYAIVGAYGEDTGGIFAGAAYIFHKDKGGIGNWGEVKKIQANDKEGGDQFGNSVSILGDYAIVGAWGEETGGIFVGAAYIFHKNKDGTNNWGEVQKIQASDKEEGDEFGSSVSISGDYAIVGAFGEDTGQNLAGAAYIFHKGEGGTNKWGEVQKIQASDKQAIDRFGWSVSISGDYVIVGSPFEDTGGESAGAAYVFQSCDVYISGELQYCASDNSTTLDAGNGTNYKWSNGETSQEIEVSEGTYTVTVTNSNGCTGTDEVSVTENANPVPAFNNHTLNENWVVCSEEMEAKYKLKREELGSDGNYNNSFDNYADYTWTVINGDFANNPNKNEGKRTAKVDWGLGPVTGKVLVTVTDANGCQGNTMLSIEVLAPLQPVITGTFEYCRGREATLDVGTYALAPQTYLWSNGETVQSFSTTSIGVYTVTVTNQEGCTGTAMVEVSATPCLAEAGVLTTNQNTICVGGDLEISSTGNQIGSNYRHYFFVYSQDNLGNTLYQKSAIANYGTGTAKASFGGLSAGDYLVCSYNECKDCLPNPSPVIFTTPMNDIYQTGTIQDGCFDIECVELTVPEAFEPNTAGTGIVAENNAAGQTIFVAEVCGGTMPYSIEFEKSGGFALVNDYPSPIAGCLKYQVLYVPEADWTLTVTDANNCNNETVVFTNEDLIDESEPQIVSHEIDLESCPGYADGSISIEVEGGSDGCNEYTYQWSGPNSFTSTALGEVTGNEATGLASGKYDVTVTDCTGTTATLEDINVTRKTRGRGGRGGCKTVEGQENRMLGVYPNPFGAQTSIEFILAESSKVWLSVYSMDGRKVAELLQGEEVEGELLQRMDFDAEQLQNGAYILKLQTESGERFYEKLMVNK